MRVISCTLLLTLASARPQQEFFTLSIDFGSDQFQAPVFSQQNSPVTPAPGPNRSAPAPPINQLQSQTLRPSVPTRRQPPARESSRRPVFQSPSIQENLIEQNGETKLSFDEALAQNREFRKQWEAAIDQHNMVVEQQQKLHEETQNSGLTTETLPESTTSPPRRPNNFLPPRRGHQTSTSNREEVVTSKGEAKKSTTLEKSNRGQEQSTPNSFKDQEEEPEIEGSGLESHLRLLEKLNREVEELEELARKTIFDIEEDKRKSPRKNTDEE